MLPIPPGPHMISNKVSYTQRGTVGRPSLFVLPSNPWKYRLWVGDAIVTTWSFLFRGGGGLESGAKKVLDI